MNFSRQNLNKECPEPWLLLHGFKFLPSDDDLRGDMYEYKVGDYAIIIDAWWDVSMGDVFSDPIEMKVSSESELLILMEMTSRAGTHRKRYLQPIYDWIFSNTILFYIIIFLMINLIFIIKTIII